MRYILPLGLLMIGTVITAYAQMYDPFYKSARMKKVHTASPGLLMPLPPLLGAPMIVIPPTVVTAVMNNKAFINGEWYKIGERIDHKEITSIQPNFVTLKEGNRLTVLGVGNQRRVLGTKETQ